MRVLHVSDRQSIYSMLNTLKVVTIVNKTCRHSIPTCAFPRDDCVCQTSLCFSLFQKHFTCKRPAPLYTHLQEASPLGGSFARVVCSYLWFVLCHCLLLYVVCRCLLLIFVVVNHCLSLFVAVCHLSLFVV